MQASEDLIRRFYSAFKNSDSGAMIACYHPEVEFTDPVFPGLKGKRAMAMWAFLCQRKADPASRWFENVRTSGEQGFAHWEAKYAFPLNGRPVHNKIEATFSFRDGKVVRHVDHFDFWRWSRMAFGPVGWALGWTPFFRKAVQKKLGARLDEFIAQNPTYR